MKNFFVFIVFFYSSSLWAQTAQIDHLEKQLHDPSMIKRHTAADQLTQIGGEEVRAIFERMVAKGGVENKRVGLVGLAQVAPYQSESLFAEELKSGSWEVRWAAVYGLGHTGNRDWLQNLSEISKEDPTYLSLQKRYPVRQAALEAMQRIEHSPPWSFSLDRALNQRKRILVFWMIPSEPWSKKMLQESFLHPGYGDLDQAFIWVQVNVLNEKETAERFNIQDVPCLQLLSSEGKELELWKGFFEAKVFVEELTALKKGAPTSEDLRQNKDSLEAAWTLSCRYARNQQLDLAAPLWERILQHDSNVEKQKKALFGLGFYYGSIGRHHQAVRLFKRFLKEYPEDKQCEKTRYCLALSLLALGQKRASITCLNALLRESTDLKEQVTSTLKEIQKLR